LNAIELFHLSPALFAQECMLSGVHVRPGARETQHMLDITLVILQGHLIYQQEVTEVRFQWRPDWPVKNHHVEAFPDNIAHVRRSGSRTRNMGPYVSMTVTRILGVGNHYIWIDKFKICISI